MIDDFEDHNEDEIPFFRSFGSDEDKYFDCYDEDDETA